MKDFFKCLQCGKPFRGTDTTDESPCCGASIASIGRTAPVDMYYNHGQILTFSLRALYRFGLGMTGLKDSSGSADRQRHFDVMQRHIDFIQECIEHLPEKPKDGP